MRIREGLFALVPLAAAALIAAPAAGSSPPGSSYPWVHPGCALPVVVTCTQPPPSVPIGTASLTTPIPGSSYEWSQPGNTVSVPEAQPPAWVPIAGS